jgi:hypothetical protein
MAAPSESYGIILEIAGSDAADASNTAMLVKSRLLDLTENSILCSLRNADPTTMDFGSTLVLVFGTPAAIAVAKGIHEAMKRFSNAVVIKTNSGSIIATGDAAAKMSIDRVASALLAHGRLEGK